jgi:hypothetical protein
MYGQNVRGKKGTLLRDGQYLEEEEKRKNIYIYINKLEDSLIANFYCSFCRL